MKLIIVSCLLLVGIQAEYDWNTIKPKHVNPILINDSYVPQLRIVGGHESVAHSRPFQVGLLLPVEGGTSFCGGSIISSRTILTAAHCVDSLIGPVEVILGAHRINQIESTQKRFHSRDILIHPGWNSQALTNDVALIFLPRAIDFNRNIQKIALPFNQPYDSYEGSNAVVSGWGKDSDQSNSISPVLREVQVPVIGNGVCNIAFFGSINADHICTSGTGGKSSCQGDSGGPLVVDGIQVGIVSFGIALGCEAGWPAVFARTTSYLEWIGQNLR